MKPSLIKKHNETNCVFHLNKKEAIRTLETMLNIYKIEYNVNLQLSENIPVAIGASIDRIPENNKHGYIGINGLTVDDTNIHKKSTLDRLRRTSNDVPDKNFIDAAITIFHEARHLHLAQNNYENINADYMIPTDDPNYNNDTINKAITISYVAAHASDYYTSHTRTNFPMEIDAEYNSIITAYKSLCKTFPHIKPEIIEKTMVDHINNKIQNCTYVIKDKNVKLTKILEPDKNGNIKVADSFKAAFSSAMKECISPKNRDKPEYERLYFMNKRHTNDEVVKTLQEEEWSSIRNRVFEAKGSEKDQMIAAIITHLHPEYNEKMPILNGLELSDEEIFGEPFPDTTLDGPGS